MSGEVGKISKPPMRGLLHGQIKRNLFLVGVNMTIAALYMKFGYGYGNMAKYANFYKTYDAEKEFDKMRKKGLFDSCDTN